MNTSSGSAPVTVTCDQHQPTAAETKAGLLNGTLTLKKAARSLKIAIKTVEGLIAKREIKCYLGRRGERRVPMKELRKAVESRAGRWASGPAPADGARPKVLAKELGIREGTIKKWCTWREHPALGRRIRCGVGEETIQVKEGARSSWKERHWRGPMASRSDIEQCVRAIREPFFRFPGNPGFWISIERTPYGKKGDVRLKGVFQHDDGRLFFTVGKAEEYLKLPPTNLHLAAYRDKLESMEVIMPCAPVIVREERRWRIEVFSQESLDRLAEWRDGKAYGGQWLVGNEHWLDEEGSWYSSFFVGRNLGIPSKRVAKLREIGYFTRHKRTPRDHSEKAQHRVGPAINVYHQDEVFPLLGLPAPSRGEDAPNNTREPNPFIPTPFQERVLKALDKKMRTASQLQADLGGIHRQDLYDRGITPLMKAGRILNLKRPGGGYFRKDAPPPKIAEFLGHASGS